MSRRRRVVALLIVCALVAAARPVRAQHADFGKTTTIQLPKGHALQDVAYGDLNGDGVPDLVLCASRRGRARVLRVHYRKAGAVAFGADPDLEVDVLEDVVAIATGDVHPDPGDEIVMFFDGGAYAYRSHAPEQARYQPLLDADFLWQLPHDRKTVVWQDAVRDIDGDGLDDLLVPEPGGYTVALQRRGGKGFGEVRRLRLPGDAAAALDPVGARRMRGRRQGRQIEITLNLGSSGAAKTDLLTVTESTPAPHFLDWDADGDVDLLAQTSTALHVWLQGAAGRFSEQPDVELPLPLEVDRRRLLDVSFSAHAADLDGDHRADYVLLAGDKRSDDPRVQVLVYRQPRGDGRNGDGATSRGARLFGERGRPEQLLVIAGIAGAPRLTDVDGDGRPDLVLGAVRLDVIDAVRAVSGSAIGAELYVYRNQGGTFSRSPDMTYDVDVPAKQLRKAERALLARFVGDVTGDGVSELLLRNDPRRLRLMYVRNSGGDLAVLDRPLWETSVEDDAVVGIQHDGAGAPEIVVRESTRLLHVRFR